MTSHGLLEEMSSVKIIDVLKDLRAESSEHAFKVAEIADYPGLYIATDKTGRPSLFVKAVSHVSDPPLRTMHVSLRPNQRYSITFRNGLTEESLFHVLSCETSENSDTESFITIINALLKSGYQKEIGFSNLSSFFRSLIRLFSTEQARDLDRERIGLWGELFMMKSVHGFNFWAPFWRSDPIRRFDFSAGERHIEVKTTTGAERVHHFSHNQIFAGEGEEIVIASLMLNQDNSGLSLRDLILECKEEWAHTSHFLKLERAIRSTGMNNTADSGPAFNHTEAQKNLAWFRSTDAPHFRVPEPPGVYETRYKVNFSDAPVLEEEKLDSWLSNWTSIQKVLKA